MPILEQGYEPYRGPVRKGGTRCGPIAGTALKRNRRWYVWVLLVMSLLFGSAKEYVLVLACYLPSVLFGREGNAGPAELFRQAMTSHPNFYSDMMATQTFWAIVMGTVVGAGEIAEDLRSGALVFYLGRPLTRLDYVLGKAIAVSLPVLLVTLVPTLLLFTLQATFEGTWAWFSGHLRVLPAATAYGLLVALFVSGFVLGVSAVAGRRRWATVSIVGLLMGLGIVALILAPPRAWESGREQRDIVRSFEKARTPEERAAARDRLASALDPLASGSTLGEWRALSPSASLAACARDLFGNPLPWNFPWHRHWIFVLAVPLGLFGLLWRRVRGVEVVT